MKKHMFIAGAAVLTLGLSVSMASAATAPCPFNIVYEHPVKAASIKTSLTQAFVSCGNPGGNIPNGYANGGSTIPVCVPAQTRNEQAGNGPPAPGGWQWGPKGTGSLSFKAGKNKIIDPDDPLLNPPGSVDLFISVKLSGVENDSGISHLEPGRVGTLSRATIIDRTSGQLETVIDFPTGFGIVTNNGKVNKKTSATEILNGLGQSALPGCSNIELVDVRVKDPNSVVFAGIGTYLPAY